jgi:hypothetical protein
MTNRHAVKANIKYGSPPSKSAGVRYRANTAMNAMIVRILN